MQGVSLPDILALLPTGHTALLLVLWGKVWYDVPVSRSRYLFILIIVGVLAVGLGLLVLPTLIRALPGRYAYYLPEPFQAWRHQPHPDILPTPISSPIAVTTAPPLSPTLPPTEPPKQPTDTPTASPTTIPTPIPTATPLPPPVRFVLEGVRHEHQGWNNCGPTTLAMALSYWGRSETQYDVAPVLKPDPEDKNVSLWEMENYVHELGLGGITRVGGSLETLQALVRAGFPVIVETWYVREATDQMGHYRLVVGYDDGQAQFVTYDSLHGPDVPVGYREMDELWRVFNRAYLVVYPLEKWGLLSAVLGDTVYDSLMYAEALATAYDELDHPPAACVAYADCADWEAFSWFNIGSSLTSLGRHTEAAPAYDQARKAGLPYRMLWYQFGPYESYYAVGRYQDVIVLTDATLATAANLEESYYWRGMARLALGDRAGAMADFEAALHYHPGWLPASNALAGLRE